MAVTIKQIAEMCGVSRGTVDRVLNNRGRVSEETARKVTEAVEALGYKPNAFGKALAMQKKKIRIGVILCSLGNVFYDDVIKGLKDAESENKKFHIEVVYRYMKGYDVKEQLRLMADLKDQVQGLILTAIDDIQIARKIDEYMDEGKGVFTLNTDISASRRISYVGVDVMECGRIACGLISLLCHEQGKVLIETGSLALLESRNRIFGFCEAMDKRYPGIKLAEIIETQDDNEEAYRKTVEFLSRGIEIEAIFLAGAGAEGVCKALEEYNKTDIRVVVCDTIPIIRRLMEERRVQAAIGQQPCLQGYTALNTVVRYMLGGLPDHNVAIENEIKLYENI